jgi:SAM-dependent methyltransferase
MSVYREGIVNRVEHNLRRGLDNVVSADADFRSFAEDSLDRARIKEQWDTLVAGCSKGFRKGQKILEIGSGFGGFVVFASGVGMKAFGIELEQERLFISTALRSAEKTRGAFFVMGVGEDLPFPENSFDIIYSTNVLEHVRDPAAVIMDSFRVLKPRGIMQFVIPNYGSWWEGHYGILWLPNLPRSLAKWYVRLFGRDPRFLDTLQFITRPGLEKCLAKLGNRVEILGWGVEIWEKRVRTLDFSKWACLGKLNRILQWIHKLGMVHPIIWLGKKLHWETPIILTVRKTP